MNSYPTSIWELSHFPLKIGSGLHNLSGILRYNLLGRNGFFQGIQQERHFPIPMDSMEPALGFQQDRARPSPSHIRISPAFYISAKILRPRKGTLNDIRTTKDPMQRGR